MNLEYIGYLASIMIVVSLLMKSILRLRVINLIGAIIFTLYGLLIKSYPVAASNGAIILIDLYYLYQMYKGKDEQFKLMPSSSDDDYFNSFMELHAADIQLFNPSFVMPEGADVKIAFILRDMVPAGVVIAHPEKDGFQVDLDYAIPQYRDLKVGNYVFSNKAIFSEADAPIKVYAIGETKKHISYLKKTGFEHLDGNMYVITVA
jgi:hypothetical protein